MTSHSFYASHWRSYCLNNTHPAQLGELGLMRMNHVSPRIPERHFQNRPFPLTHHNRIGELIRLQARPRPIHIEKGPVEMERVNQVKFSDIDQIHAHQFADFDLNWCC